MVDGGDSQIHYSWHAETTQMSFVSVAQTRSICGCELKAEAAGILTISGPVIFREHVLNMSLSASASFRKEFSKELEVATSMKETILKAVEPKEKPIKAKHIRNVVLLAHKENGVQEFWANCAFNSSHKPSVLGYWKFFQLFHNIIKGNHPTVLRDSHKFKGVIQQQGLYWSTADPSSKYGPLLRSYCQVLLVKMEFHYNNPNIPGSVEMDDATFLLLIENSEKEFIAEMLKEILRYWSVIEDFLTELLGEVPAKSKTCSEEFQCKFQPFILCVEEARYLYKYARTILYKLHTDYPSLNVQSMNSLFMSLYDFQSIICTKAFAVEWLATSTDLTFISDQSIPEVFRQPRSKNHGSHSSSNSQAASSAASTDALVNLSETTSPSAPPPLLPDHREMQIQKSRELSPVMQQQPSMRPNNGVNMSANENAVLQARVRQQELELRQQAEMMSHLTLMNSHLTAENERLAQESVRLNSELTQLKINSGRQFCQLYAAIREKDERLKQLESS